MSLKLASLANLKFCLGIHAKAFFKKFIQKYKIFNIKFYVFYPYTLANSKLKAITNITIPTKISKIFHEISLAKIGAKTLAPYPKEKKKTNDARLAPMPKIMFSPPNFIETDPIKSIV